MTPNAVEQDLRSSDPAFTGTLTGFLPADNVTATYSRTAGETVAGSPYLISATLNTSSRLSKLRGRLDDVLSNYTITYNTAQLHHRSGACLGDAECGDQGLRPALIRP